MVAMVEVAWMVNGLPPDRRGAEIPVKESREPLLPPPCRDLLPWTALPGLIRRARHVSHKPTFGQQHHLCAGIPGQCPSSVIQPDRPSRRVDSGLDETSGAGRFLLGASHVRAGYLCLHTSLLRRREVIG